MVGQRCVMNHRRRPIYLLARPCGLGPIGTDHVQCSRASIQSGAIGCVVCRGPRFGDLNVIGEFCNIRMGLLRMSNKMEDATLSPPRYGRVLGVSTAEGARGVWTGPVAAGSGCGTS